LQPDHQQASPLPSLQEEKREPSVSDMAMHSVGEQGLGELFSGWGEERRGPRHKLEPHNHKNHVCWW